MLISQLSDGLAYILILQKFLMNFASLFVDFRKLSLTEHLYLHDKLSPCLVAAAHVYDAVLA